jgi:hypothetical protein
LGGWQGRMRIEKKFEFKQNKRAGVKNMDLDRSLRKILTKTNEKEIWHIFWKLKKFGNNLNSTITFFTISPWTVNCSMLFCKLGMEFDHNFTESIKKSK